MLSKEELDKVREIVRGYGYPARAVILNMADTIEQLQQIRRNATDAHIEIQSRQAEQIEQLQKEVEQLKESLQFYASFWNHDVQLEDIGITSMQRDRGEMARKSLGEEKTVT